MTIPSSSVDVRTDRSPAQRSDRKSRAAGKSGASRRAYERRQQRAVAHTSDSARSSEASGVASLNGQALVARIPFVALIIGLLGIGLGLTLLLTTRAAGDSYDLSAAKAVNTELIQQRASLQRDVELAESAPELARKAADLGMVPANNVARLVVAPDGGVQVIGEPAPADGTPLPPLDPVTTAQAVESTEGFAVPPNSRTQVPIPRSASAPNATTDTRADSRTAAPAIPGTASASNAGTPNAATPDAADPNASDPNTVVSDAATPNRSNGAETEGLPEQLVPMNLSPADPAGDGQ